MILGMYYTGDGKHVKPDDFEYFTRKNNGIDNDDVTFFIKGSLGLIFKNEKLPVRRKKEGIFTNSENSIITVFEGNIFNSELLLNDLATGKKETGNNINYAELLYLSYNKWGKDCFSKINGNFIACVFDNTTKNAFIARDHLGIEPLFYYWDGDKLLFSSALNPLIQNPRISAEINYEGLYSYLLFNYNPSLNTLVKNVKKIRPAHYLTVTNRNLQCKPYWFLSFVRDETIQSKDETEICDALFHLMKDTVAIRIAKDENKHGAFLSGGMDSSSIVGLMSDLGAKPIHTFSFRCKGKTFDESNYAKIMSDRYATSHYLVEYPPEEIKTISEMIEVMDEPFCDIGIEVATYILGREANGKTNYVLTGDGGDELFAGHPVYLADNVARKFAKVPRFLQIPITKILQFLPDTDKKKSFVVKAKRFSYSYNFPAELFSNRWRLYYTFHDLKKLLNSHVIAEFNNLNSLDQIAKLYHDADGEDFLSKTLYGDYQTVVGFYFARMKLLKKFGIEGRFPMFDYRLVDFAAKLPSELKLRGSETKYILHKTMTGFLPDEIVFRKDKLGHSVPMKNWIRETPVVKEFIYDNLSESSIKKMNFFKSSYIQKLLTQHLKKTSNHSHRLWALVVLNLWMNNNL